MRAEGRSAAEAARGEVVEPLQEEVERMRQQLEEAQAMYEVCLHKQSITLFALSHRLLLPGVDALDFPTQPKKHNIVRYLVPCFSMNIPECHFQLWLSCNGCNPHLAATGSPRSSSSIQGSARVGFEGMECECLNVRECVQGDVEGVRQQAEQHLAAAHAEARSTIQKAQTTAADLQVTAINIPDDACISAQSAAWLVSCCKHAWLASLHSCHLMRCAGV